MSAHILAEQFTTGDVARALGVTDEGVRYLEREAYLHAARTVGGWRLFQKGDVLRLAERRTEARLRSVKRLRPKKFGRRGGPRQLSLFAPRLRIVGRAPTLGKGQVDRARSRRKRSGSDNGRDANQRGR
jgi:hypothetical protein